MEGVVLLLGGENEDRKSWISSYSNCSRECSVWGRGWTQCQTKPWILSPAPLFKKVLLNESGQRAEGHLVSFQRCSTFVHPDLANQNPWEETQELISNFSR